MPHQTIQVSALTITAWLVMGAMFLPRSVSLYNNGVVSSDGVDVDPPQPSTTTSTSLLSSPESSAVQTLSFGIVAAILAILALFLSYRQLRTMRRGPKFPLPPVEDRDGADAACQTSRPGAMGHERPLLIAKVYTFQQYAAPFLPTWWNSIPFPTLLIPVSAVLLYHR